MKKRRTAILMLALLLILSCWSGYAVHVQEQLANKVLRLHVIANSDSKEDQRLKMKVKDRVYDAAEFILKEAKDREDAVQRLNRELARLKREAIEALQAEGCGDSVSVKLEETDFPTKEYDGFAFPAGRYLALRVIIGSGEGKNWWCVVFPPLCSASAAEFQQQAHMAGMTEEEIRLITEEDGGCVFRFRLVELWQKLFCQIRK